MPTSSLSKARPKRSERRPTSPDIHPFERPATPVNAPRVDPHPHWKQWASALLNPVKLAESPLSWKAVLLIPTLAFALFFVQIGLDQSRLGLAGWLDIAGLTIMGGLFGLILVPVTGSMGWLGARVFGGEKSFGWSIRAFNLVYLSALVYGGVGLMANLLFGWQTAVAFGATGVLWSLAPMLTVLRQMTGNRLGVSIILTTLCGLLVLLGWAGLGAAG